MNYLIIGLGNFGVALATRLTQMGHDVTGIDADMRVVEEYKSQITTTMCVNIIDQVSIKALPLDDTDIVIVSLGNHIGESIVIVSLLKQAGVKHIVARAVNPMHRTILETIGVDEVIEPEKTTADIWSYSAEAEKIKGEFSANGFTNNLEHKRGVLSMARGAYSYDSASSQFFICHVDYPSLNGQYAAFGEVVYGMETVDAIAVVATDENDKPISDVVIESAQFVTKK